MSENLNDPGHGDSVASWTTVIIIMIAFAIGTLAFWFNLPVLVWVSAVIAAAGVPVGIYLKRAGYGVGGEKSKKSH
jgi:Flp pilus assembly protein TadB